MKKIIILAFALLSLNVFAVSVSVGGGVHAGGTYVSEKPNAFELAALYVGMTPKSLDGKVHDFKGAVPFVNVEVTQGLVIGDIGVGASYEQGYEREDGITYDAVPVYGIVKLNLFPILVKPYIAAKFGTVLYQNVEGTTSTFESPVFYSLGVGLTLAGKITVEGTVQGTTYQLNGTDQGSATYGVTGRFTF